MRRLVHPEISQQIEFEENRINTVVIENRDFFRRILTDLAKQINGEDGEFILSSDYAPIEISTHVELITQVIPFEINRKSLLTKIYAFAEHEAVNESNFTATQELLSHIERHIHALLFSCSYDFEIEKLNIGTIVKSIGIVLSENYDNELEKLLDYMQLVREFDREKIFIYVNLRSYFSDIDMEIFAKEAVSRKFQILLIENMENKRLSFEKRLIIDKDLCEIY